MPVDVPQESKTYTTIYEGFKGVDFTNDPSNIYRRRSPTGKNMLPDLDGRPYKRSGWEVALSASDFRTAAGINDNTVPVIPDKTYYFELGGYDHIIIFNNLGVFSYSTDQNGTSAEDMVLRYHDTYKDLSNTDQSFPPQISGEDVPADSKKAFFFEGKGKAGFYIFVGLKLFRYDGTNIVEEEPYTPTVLFACDKDGAGTMLESVNLLTRYRTVRYLCDGTTTKFTLPSGLYNASQSSIKSVEKMSASGKWVDATNSVSSVTATSFTMSSAPPVTIQGEDNLRITYLPNVLNDTLTTDTVTRWQKKVTLVEIKTQMRTKLGTNGVPGAWVDTGARYEALGATFDVSNITVDPSTHEKNITFEARDDTDSSWVTIPSDCFVSNYNAYSELVMVEPNEHILGESIWVTSENTVTGSGTVWEVLTKNDSTNAEDWTYIQHREVRVTRVYDIRIQYDQYQYADAGASDLMAFSQCSKAMVFGSGIINQVFLTSSPSKNFTSRVWYSAATDPTYFPDTNYIEVGASDTPIMGLMKVGQYLGVIKKSAFIDTSIYLAYPTSFDENTTYAVKQSINGFGSVSNGAFNTLNEEPIFLSRSGVMGIDITADAEWQVKPRSFFVNKKLTNESNLECAISFVYNGCYYLAVNNRCYVLDGSQKNSWANTKTNLQYECYYLENVPAQCFAKLHDELWFSDFRGNLCRFKGERDEKQFVDDYSVFVSKWSTSTAPVDDKIDITQVDGDGTEDGYLVDEHGDYLVDTEDPDDPDDDAYIRVITGMADVGDVISYEDIQYTIESIDENNIATLLPGVPIDAEWSTLADDDGMVHFFKNLKKKGCVISLLPSSDSGVSVYVRADTKDAVLVGTTDAKDYELPFDFFAKKKIKKYKRLQFICRNNVYGDSFGLDQIIKTYTVGNYSKRR